MADSVTYTGLISFAGREFRYSYRGPTQQAIDSKVAELKSNNSNNWKTDDQLKVDAASKLMLEARTEAADKAISFLSDATKKKLRVSRSGISQLDIAPMELDVIAKQYGLVPNEQIKEVKGTAESMVQDRPDPVLDPDGARKVTGADFITEEEIRKVPGKLVDKLNEAMFQEWKKSSDQIVANVKLSRPVEEDSFGDQINNIALQMAGGGRVDSSLTQEMFNLNRFGRSFVGPNRELTGWTFITRPHCNLSTANLASAVHFMPLVHATPRSIPFAIRSWLDTSFSYEVRGSIGRGCPFVDYKNPFLVPICNRLSNLSGWPDFSVATETSEGGFFSENQTVGIGGDQLARGYDFTLNFEEMSNGLIMSIFDYWSQYISMIGDGRLHQHKTDIENHLLGYTVSIYRFITDHTGRNITRWAKATGCYPKNIPTGTAFNKNKGEGIVQAANDVAVTFQVHRAEYNNPRILWEFNTLVDRYMGPWSDKSFEIGNNIANNYMGTPYITQRNGRTQLIWRCDYDYGANRPLAATDRSQKSSKPGQITLMR